jgi:hypothetical protein
MYKNTRKILEDELKWIKNPIGKKEDIPNSSMTPIMGCLEFENHYVFWCPHCESIHWHGNSEGHRTVHCEKKDSPFSQTGYWLKKIGDFELPKWVKKHG